MTSSGVPDNGLAWRSHMPDLGVYNDDKVTDYLGRPSNQRIELGDWRDLGNLPVDKGQCDAMGWGSGGNPWAIEAPVPLTGDGPTYARRRSRMVTRRRVGTRSSSKTSRPSG
ncbi:putative protein OS=Streptomyces griseomycini OX=66895 GN=FHS37_003384 PE=4 SV=1 [Streptomyces griseomycini]